jgi:hypothetical protein
MIVVIVRRLILILMLLYHSPSTSTTTPSKRDIPFSHMIIIIMRKRDISLAGRTSSTSTS